MVQGLCWVQGGGGPAGARPQPPPSTPAQAGADHRGCCHGNRYACVYISFGSGTISIICQCWESGRNYSGSGYDLTNPPDPALNSNLEIVNKYGTYHL